MKEHTHVDDGTCWGCQMERVEYQARLAQWELDLKIVERCERDDEGISEAINELENNKPKE